MSVFNYVVIDLAKLATSEARYTISLQDKPLNDVVSVRLVGYAFKGIENSVTANQPDVPYYVLRFKRNFPSAVAMFDASGERADSVPLQLLSAPFCSVRNEAYESAPEVFHATHAPGTFGQFEVEIVRPVAPILPQQLGSSASRGTSVFPAFTDGLLVFRVERQTYRRGEPSFNTVGQEYLAHRREVTGEVVSTTLATARERMAKPHGAVGNAMWAGTRRLGEKF